MKVNRRKQRLMCLCVALMLLLLSGCSAEARVQLTEEQENRVDMIVQHRDEWETYREVVRTYYINRLYISEEEGNTILTVAYVVKEDSMMQYFVGLTGYTVTDEDFIASGDYDMAWMANAEYVDMETMSDEELREVVRQSYIGYLSNE